MNKRCKIGRAVCAQEEGEGQRANDRKTERIRKGPTLDFKHAMSPSRGENGTVEFPARLLILARECVKSPDNVIKIDS